MDSVNLRIENGQLLKPYTLPFNTKTGAHVDAPPDWTPLQCEWTREQAARIAAKSPEPLPPSVVMRAAELANIARLMKLRRPCPGWVMVGPPSNKADKHIRKAYRELFKRLGHWPPDGDYVLRNGVMRSAE